MSEPVPTEPSQLGSSPRPVIIGIDGRSGSGKTSLAGELASLLREHRKVSLFHLEDIYPGWNGLATGVERYLQTVLTPLAAGRDAQWTSWDWAAHFDGETRLTNAAEIVIVEGVGAAQSAARALLDVAIWVDAPDDVRKKRALSRDGETYAPCWELWAAQETEMLAIDHPAEQADIVANSPVAPADLVKALTALPQFSALLAPEIQAARAQSTQTTNMPFDGDPLTLFHTLYGDSENAAWLDSSDAAAKGSRNRFSIMADDGGPAGQFAWHTEGLTHQRFRGITAHVPGAYFRWLNAQWSGFQDSDDSAEIPFTLGWIGYLGYELKRETGGSNQNATSADAHLIFAGRAVVIDHQEKLLWALNLPDENEPSWADQVAAAVAASAKSVTLAAEPVNAAVSVRDSASAYKAKIARAQAEIVEGNSYEICLTTAVKFPLNADPLALYALLRSASPAPFAAYLRFGKLAVLSTSPERLLQITRAGTLTAEPIKGTRRRDADPLKDAALRAELEASEKDRAENIMIVDLMRNDLSHFAVPGSVRVDRLCAIESYASIHQMVSTVTAKLRTGASRAEAVAVAFPAGSMTGAPKINTMRILDELEGQPRGIYSGAIGYFSRDGGVDLSVVIRTLVIDNGLATLGVGGAITADSAPEEEWQEARTKAFGVLNALGLEFPLG